MAGDALDIGHGVARVDDERGVLADEVVVDAVMVGDDEYAIGRFDFFGGQFDALEIDVVLAHFGECGAVGVVVLQFGAVVHELLDDLGSGRFTDIIDIGLVRDAEHEDARATDGLGNLVQRFGHARDDITWHLRVDLASEFDELGRIAGLFGFPGEIERVDRDAVPAEAGSGVERLKPERLGGGGVNDFPDVNAEAVEDDLEFIDQCDIDGAVDVFEQFGGFCDFGGLDAVDAFDDLGVERHGEVSRVFIDAADEFGDLAGRDAGSARVFTLRAVREKEVNATFEPGAFEDGHHLVACGAGVGG